MNAWSQPIYVGTMSVCLNIPYLAFLSIDFMIFRNTILVYITKTRIYNFDPLKPHLYIVKLGFTGVYTSFLISAQNIDCGYSLKPPRWGGSNEYPQSIFEQKYKKYQIF